MGRHKIKIDFGMVDNLCNIQCTTEEIASVLNVSVDTLERRCKEEKEVTFAVYSAQKRQGGKMSLRRKQMELALAGDKTMLIWLGKQYLEQSDKTDSKIGVTVNSWDALEKKIAEEKKNAGG